MSADKLRDYEAKRDFEATPEPAPAARRRRAKKPRFVIQEHSATRLHWDLRLEHDGALASWALPNGVPDAPKDNRLAVRTEDHPLEYLKFQGEIPQGSYGAGTMTIWDQGTFDVLKWEDRKIEVDLHGKQVSGRYALFAISKPEEEKEAWMIHRMDPPADPEAEAMPERIVPMLARSAALPEDAERWAFEIKWDGVRAICFSEPGRMRLVTRNLNEVTARYPELARLNRALHHHRAVLDGEIVAFDEEGRPSFAALQGRMHVTGEARVRRLANAAPVTYVLFDLLWLDGHSLMHLPYEERRARLKELELDAERWQTPEHVVGQGAALQEVSREQGLEGIVAKRLDSPYEPGRRSPCWLKIKNVNRQELVIGGWLPGEGRRRNRIGALLVGVREDGRLRFAGRVGTGFTEAELERLRALLEPLEQEGSPFEAGLKPPRNAVFVRPQLVAEVEFVEWTRDGVLRAPSYKGLRDDKPAELVIREPGAKPKTVRAEIEGHELTLSNLDKVLYPETGFTKRDLIDYYVTIAPVLLPHLEGRPLTLKRYPNGVDGDFFYEKNAPSHRPDWVQTATVEGITYVVVDGVATLAWLGNLADLELHTPMARAADADRPTMVAFDLDPGPPAGLTECCRIALVLNGMFEHLGLRSCPKTSGSKGMQVYLPLNAPGVTASDTKSFAKAVAELLEAEAPDLAVSRQTKTLRKGKVLVDWSQNDEHKTTVTVYSPRARDTPTVSTPVTWDEVRAGAEGQELAFTTDQVLARVRESGDLFADVLSVVQELPAGGRPRGRRARS